MPAYLQRLKVSGLRVLASSTNLISSIKSSNCFAVVSCCNSSLLSMLAEILYLCSHCHWISARFELSSTPNLALQTSMFGGYLDSTQVTEYFPGGKKLIQKWYFDSRNCRNSIGLSPFCIFTFVSRDTWASGFSLLQSLEVHATKRCGPVQL